MRTSEKHICIAHATWNVAGFCGEPARFSVHVRVRASVLELRPDYIHDRLDPPKPMGALQQNCCTGITHTHITHKQCFPQFVHYQLWLVARWLKPI